MSLPVQVLDAHALQGTSADLPAFNSLAALAGANNNDTLDSIIVAFPLLVIGSFVLFVIVNAAKGLLGGSKSNFKSERD